MPNAEKVEKVAALKERIEGSTALLLTEYRGLSVADATELRRALSGDARFSVVKNTLFRRAAGEAGIEDLEALLDGPTAVAFVGGDVVAVAKKVIEAAKRHPALVLKGAYLEGRVLGAVDAQALATLESREVMLSRIAGMVKAEMTRTASMFQALQGRFLGLLEAYREKLPAEAEVPAAEASAETAPGETEDAPTGETTPEADTAEPAPAEEPAEEPEAASERSTEQETGEDEDAPAPTGTEEE